MSEYSGLKNTFFSRDRKSALKRLRELARRDRYYRGKTIKLNPKQVWRMDGWKTWKIIRKK